MIESSSDPAGYARLCPASLSPSAHGMDVTEEDHRPPVRLAVVILTKDEEARIAGALESVAGISELVVVIDSESTDQTREVAASLGAIVRTRAFDNFSAQRNFALDYVVEHFSPRWILALDADERVTPALAAEIDDVTRKEPPEADAYLLPMRVTYSGRRLRYGGFGSMAYLRLFRPQSGRYEARGINEHFVLHGGVRIGRAKGVIEHEDIQSWSRHIAKHNNYSTLEAAARATRKQIGAGTISLKMAFL